jgi:Rap1a immunity proteins
MKCFVIFSLAVFAVTGGQAQPRSFSMSDMSEFPFGLECSRENGLEFSPCAAYILASVDQLSMSGQVCLPSSGGGNAQNLAVVRKYLKDHPERWNQHPAVVVKQAMIASFPCRRQK